MDGFGASFTDSSAWLVWNKLTTAQRQSKPRIGTPGSEGVAYFNPELFSQPDASPYRPGESGALESTSDIGGGYDVGNTNPGDWLNYTVNIAAARSYTLQVRVASGVPGGTLHLACDGRTVTQSISVPWTTGWETFETLEVSDVKLPAGIHVLQLVMDNPGVYSAIAKFNWFALN